MASEPETKAVDDSCTPSTAAFASSTSTLRVGQYLDIKDTIGNWMEAMIVELQHDSIFVHYTWWTCKWDEWIRVPSPRLALHGSKIFLRGGVLRVGQTIEVFDDHKAMNRWSEGKVVDETPDEVKVHFKGFAPKFDKWFARTSTYLSPFGPNLRRRYPHVVRTRRVTMETQLSKFHAALAEKGMRVVACEPDGNCLFRAASHQVYGTQDVHALVRARSMDYMEVWKAHFSAFTVGNLDLFPEYVAWKRQNAVWGDEPEVQAISELYGRPVEVYAFHPIDGAVIINRMNAADTRKPLRLSFYGGGHYDSIVGPGFADALCSEPPDTVEQRALASARAQADPEAYQRALAASEDAAVEDATLAAVVQESRRLYSGLFEASLEGFMTGSPVPPTTADGAATGGASGGASGAAGGSGGASSGRSTAATAGDGGGTAAATPPVETDADVEARLVEAAAQESARLAREAEERQLKAAQEASEDAALKAVLAESRAAASVPVVDDGDLDMDMQLALQMSMQGGS